MAKSHDRDEFAIAKNFAGAAVVQDEIMGMEERLSYLRSSRDHLGRSDTEGQDYRVVVAAPAQTRQSRLLKEQISLKAKMANEARAFGLLVSSAFQRTITRFLFLLLYTVLLRCFLFLGAAGATALAYALTLLASQAHSMPHGPQCRLATAAAAGLPVAMLRNMYLGACVSIIAACLPSPWLWWPPKKTDEKLMEELIEIESWVKANLDELRSRGDGCLKLRQLNGGEETRFHKILGNFKKRIEANAALAEQMAKLHRMVREGKDADAAGQSASSWG